MGNCYRTTEHSRFRAVVDSVPGRTRSRRTWLELFRPLNPYLDLCRTLKKSKLKVGEGDFTIYRTQTPLFQRAMQPEHAISVGSLINCDEPQT
ncbi:hypothetical protein P692DRAFT_20236144 [Suillus brevipes Sb2]|nr:hypothetical protein P692DRAFT_20236144 [Suillus brevipes Sb2]